jgi:O-methyltransferase domain/Dimerisation domain
MTIADVSTAGPDSGAPTPDAIMQLGMGFWGSKALLTAVELGVFSHLATAQALDADALRDVLGLHERSARDFFDALVALGMLERVDGMYRNTPSTDLFLDRAKPTYLGGILEMANARLYGFWGSLTEGLCTGEPQNEAKTGGDLFDVIYNDEASLRGFAGAMTGISLGAAHALAANFPWEQYGSVIDIGCAEGCVPAQLLLAHDHLTGGGFDLPAMRPVFEDYASRTGVGERSRFHPGDFFVDELPQADVLVMGHILHDWNQDEKSALLTKAYTALPEGGALIVYDAIIDDDRSTNVFGLLMSLNMLIETRGGADYTGADCQGWMRAVGFSETYVKPLLGPDAMVVGIK